MKTAICALLVLAGVCLIPRTDAADIVYTFDGFGTGTVGDERFIDAVFTLEVFANTNNVMTGQIGNITFYSVEDDSSRITIGGIGNALFADPERLFCTPSVSTAGFSRSLGAQGDLLDVTAPAFASYDLRSALGPISGGTARQFFDDEPTTRGGLTFSAMRDVTFTAVVPEPSAAVVLMTAVAGGALQRRRSRQG